MNTTEKRKLEALIVPKLSEAKNAYTSRRQREHTALVVKFEKNIPEPVQKLIAKRETIQTDYSKKSEGIEERQNLLKKEYDKLCDKMLDDFQKNQNTIGREYDEMRAKRSNELDAVDKEAQKFGYKIHVMYDDEIVVKLTYETTYTGQYNNTRVRTYQEPTLSSHDVETADGEQKIDDLTHEYTVAIWADGEDMSNLLDRFREEVKELVI